MLSKQQLDSIRFYMGDPEIVNRKEMQGGLKAYNTMNALLSYDLHDEVDKVNEGRILELHNVQHLKQYIQQYVDIVQAMKDYVVEHPIETITYRIDRLSSLESIRKYGVLEGFHSSSTIGFLPQYAHSKQNVVMLEIHRYKDVPYLDFANIFEGYYAKPEEAELLLPFGTKVKHIEEIVLTEEEKELYHDIHHLPPVGKYRVYVEKPTYDMNSMDTLYEEITSVECVNRIQYCLNSLMKNHTLDNDDLVYYLAFKEKLMKYLCYRIMNF